MSKVLCGLDLASFLNGWCVGAGDEMPRAGMWRLPDCGDDFGRLLEELDGCFLALVEREKPDEVCYEAPILTRFDNVTKLRKLYSLGTHIEWRCRTMGIGYSWEDLRNLKKALTGSSSAEKKDMVAAARRVGLILPIGDGEEDAADAFAAWLCLLRARDRELSARWDQLLWSRRGRLV